MLRRRTYLLALAAIAVLAALIAFLPRTSHQQEQLTILGEDASTMQALDSVTPLFEKENSVRISDVKNAFEVLQQKASADLSSGSALYDIILNVNSSLATYVRNNWVYTLRDLERIDPSLSNKNLQSDLFPATWREVGFYPTSAGGAPGPIGYPWAANTMLLVYNKTMFDDPSNKAAFRTRFGRELTPPAGWSEFKQIAEFFTRPERKEYGVVLEGASGGWLYYEWVNFAYSMGGGVMKKTNGWEGDSNTPLILASPETIAATNFYIGLKPYNAGDYLSTGQNEQVEMMRKGDIAMAIVWSDTLYPMIHAQGGDKFGFAPIPGTKSQIGGGIFYVNKRTKHPELAAKFLQFYFKPETQRSLILKGVCSPVRSAYDDPQVQREIPYATALRTSLDRGVYMTEAGPDADAVQETVTSAVQQIWRGQTTVDAGLAAAQASLQKKRAEIFAIAR